MALPRVLVDERHHHGLLDRRHVEGREELAQGLRAVERPRPAVRRAAYSAPAAPAAMSAWYAWSDRTPSCPSRNAMIPFAAASAAAVVVTYGTL